MSIKVKLGCLGILVSSLVFQTVYAVESNPVPPPDVALLEFLGATAGLESLGVNVDALLKQAADSKTLTLPLPPSPMPVWKKNDERPE